MNEDTISLDDFRNWEFSLFKTPPGFDVMHIRRLGFEEKYSEHGNYGAATVLLQSGNLEDAKKSIDRALEIDPNSVHAWCNKGVYYLKSSPPQENKAREARNKKEELLPQDEARKTAAIEYAYWQYSIIGTVQVKEEALKLFDRLLSNESTEPVIKHHYLYMQVLTRQARQSFWNGNANMDDEVHSSVLKKLFNEALILLQTDSPDLQKLQVTVWSNLAFVLLDKTCCKLIRHGFDEESFSIHIHKISDINKMFCVQKILEIFEKNPTCNDSKGQVYATIAKVYLKEARETENYTERYELLEKALKYGQRNPNTDNTSPCFGSQVSSDILMQMWAMKYSEAESEKAWSAHREIFGNQGKSQLKLWQFLSNEFYSREADNDPDRRTLLERAHMHLEKYKKENPCKFLSKFLTVKLLLGHPTEELEAVFPRLDELETNEQRAAMLANYGRFCEINNRFQEAIQKYQTALSYVTPKNSYLWYFKMARQGKSRIEEQLNTA